MSNKSSFGTDQHGTKFVTVKSLMHPLVVISDGLPVYDIGNEFWLKLDTAIEWVQKEVVYSDGRPKDIQNLIELLKFREGR